MYFFIMTLIVLKRSPPPKTVSQYTGGFNAYNSEQEFF